MLCLRLCLSDLLILSLYFCTCQSSRGKVYEKSLPDRSVETKQQMFSLPGHSDISLQELSESNGQDRALRHGTRSSLSDRTWMLQPGALKISILGWWGGFRSWTAVIFLESHLVSQNFRIKFSVLHLKHLETTPTQYLKNQGAATLLGRHFPEIIPISTEI